MLLMTVSPRRLKISFTVSQRLMRRQQHMEVLMKSNTKPDTNMKYMESVCLCSWQGVEGRLFGVRSIGKIRQSPVKPRQHLAAGRSLGVCGQ